MRSPEYPDLAWVEPASWTDANRAAVQLVVIHTTEGGARGTAAEDGAAYDRDRDDGTSTHYFHDNDSTVQCVRTADQAHAARAQGNRRGIQHELCTKAGSATWGDAYHQAMLKRAAKQAARDARKWGIPVRYLTVAEVAAGIKGFCGHADITKAFPQDKGTHTDPGVNFPWTQFLALVRAALADLIKEKSDDMPSVSEIWNTDDMTTNPRQRADAKTNPKTRAGFALEDTWQQVYNLRDQVAALGKSLTAAITALGAKDQVDEVALAKQLVPGVVAGVIAGLPQGTEISADELKDAVLGALVDLAGKQ